MGKEAWLTWIYRVGAQAIKSKLDTIDTLWEDVG